MKLATLNVGPIERGMRILMAFVFVAAGIFVHWGFFVLAAVSLTTGALGTCPLYTALGISTAHRPKERHA